MTSQSQALHVYVISNEFRKYCLSLHEILQLGLNFLKFYSKVDARSIKESQLDLVPPGMTLTCSRGLKLAQTARHPNTDSDMP